MQFQEDFFSKNRWTLFGALKYRQTLFNDQILLYKDFCDFLRFTRPSSIANAFLQFAIQICKANLHPTYLVWSSRVEQFDGILNWKVCIPKHRWLELTPFNRKSSMNLASMGSYMTLRTIQKIMLQNRVGGPLAKRALRYPKLVPWDQIFGFKIFLLPSPYEVY